MNSRIVRARRLAALYPQRHAVAVLIAAVASLMHAILHIYSHAAGLLSSQHITTEIVGIYLPTILLCILAFVLIRPTEGSARAALHTAQEGLR